MGVLRAKSLARSGRKLEGLGADRDARENGLLIVDDLDAVYDLTFVDPDYERAEFLRPIFGVIRVNSLRAVLERHLNVDFTSPLRVDRDGFNREHEFSKALLEFLAQELRPCYERERKRIEERDRSKFSEQTRKRIEDALKHLNKFFQQITEKTGPGQGGEDGKPEPPTEPVSFFPRSTKLAAGRPRKVLLLVRDDMVNDGCEIVATAADGISVQPEIERVYRKAGSTKEETREEFDRRLSEDPKAQQRLASILLEEASFRALQQLFERANISRSGTSIGNWQG